VSLAVERVGEAYPLNLKIVLEIDQGNLTQLAGRGSKSGSIYLKRLYVELRSVALRESVPVRAGVVACLHILKVLLRGRLGGSRTVFGRLTAGRCHYAQ
jgi:hypothetical protein